MITRRLLSNCCFILLLVPTLGWTLNESGDLPAAQSASAPAQAKPEKIAPAQAVSAPTAPVAPAKPAHMLVAPLKPARVFSVPAKPGPVPVSAAQSALTLTVLKNPVPLKQVSMQSAPIPAEPESSAAALSETTDIEAFIREDCLQCDKAAEFLARLQKLKPRLKIIIRNVRKEPAALELLRRVAQNQGETALGKV